MSFPYMVYKAYRSKIYDTTHKDKESKCNFIILTLYNVQYKF